jgi:hypothetical protein
VLNITQMALHAAHRAAGRHCRCCDAVWRAEASAAQGGGACCLACDCGYTVLQSVAHELQLVTGRCNRLHVVAISRTPTATCYRAMQQSVTRGLPSDPHQLLRGLMGATPGPEVLGWNPPFITTAHAPHGHPPEVQAVPEAGLESRVSRWTRSQGADGWSANAGSCRPSSAAPSRAAALDVPHRDNTPLPCPRRSTCHTEPTAATGHTPDRSRAPRDSGGRDNPRHAGV